jgi:hypothetical protein
MPIRQLPYKSFNVSVHSKLGAKTPNEQETQFLKSSLVSLDSLYAVLWSVVCSIGHPALISPLVDVWCMPVYFFLS